MKGYVKFRRGILEHLKDGRITAEEFIVYSLIILLADHRSGVWKGCALTISKKLRKSPSWCRRILASLRKKGYVAARPTNGRGQYPIKVNKYFKKHIAKASPAPEKQSVETALEPEAVCGDYLTPKKQSVQAPYQEEVLNHQEEHIQESAKIAPLPKPTRDLPGFALFWEAYPVKFNQEGTLRQWLSKVRIDSEWLPVLEGLERWKQSRRWGDLDYVPYPEKFLNRKQWLGMPPAEGGHANGRGKSKSEERAERVRAAAERVLGTTGPVGRALRGELREGAYGRDILDLPSGALRLKAKPPE